MSHTPSSQRLRRSIDTSTLVSALILTGLITGCGEDTSAQGEETAREEFAGPVEELCDDTCSVAGNGQCDDSGPESVSAICAYGTDCGDCGPRAADDEGTPSVDPEPNPELCSDACPLANNDSCDDGGEGSDYSDCALGTDCSDCGGRLPDYGDLGPEAYEAILEICTQCLADCLGEPGCDTSPDGLCDAACNGNFGCPSGQVLCCRFFGFDCHCAEEC